MRLFCSSCLLLSCLIYFPACRQTDPAFGFHPDSSKVYLITWAQVTDSTRIENITMQLRLIQTMDSLYRLKLTFVDFKKKAPTMSFVLNGKSIPDLWQYQLGFLKGLSLDVWMNKKGEVIKMGGFDALADSVAALSGEDRRELAYSLREDAGEEIMRDRLTRLFSFVPGRRKETGQNWVIDQMLLRGAPVMNSNMYKMVRLKDDTATITVSGFVSARQGEQGRTYMKGKLAGWLMAVYSTGIPCHYSAKTETVLTNSDGRERSSLQTTEVSVQTCPQP
ncbi:MAG TPA: DUF6263 family protein [Chitinophagaceae bacterium]|jgi:hypothetical protein